MNSFRAAGLRVGLYYSILPLRDDIRHFNITPDKVRLVKDQLTELFTNYGEIDVLITDGWNAPWSRITYEEMPFREIYEHIKALQPNCLISDLTPASFPQAASTIRISRRSSRTLARRFRSRATCRLFPASPSHQNGSGSSGT